MGVWIEIPVPASLQIPVKVTPFMGVWIEIEEFMGKSIQLQVTPFMGVWIEITFPDRPFTAEISHTLYGCVD